MESSKDLRAWGDGRQQARHERVRQAALQPEGRLGFRAARTRLAQNQGRKPRAAAKCSARHLHGHSLTFPSRRAAAQLPDVGNGNGYIQVYVTELERAQIQVTTGENYKA